MQVQLKPSIVAGRQLDLCVTPRERWAVWREFAAKFWHKNYRPQVGGYLRPPACRGTPSHETMVQNDSPAEPRDKLGELKTDWSPKQA